MKLFKIGICVLILSFILIGCSSNSKPVTEVATTVAKTEEPTGELVEVSELTIKIGYNNLNNEIMGTVTNNNDMQCSFYINVIFSEEDGTPLTTQGIRIADIKPGETLDFYEMVIDTDISKATHKIVVRDFF